MIDQQKDSVKFCNTSKLPVILSYCATFLKPEMLHVYRQVTGVASYRNLVATRRLENTSLFPYGDVIKLRKSRLRWVNRIWRRASGNKVPLSRYETRQLGKLIQREHCKLIHIYFGTEAARLLSWLPHLGIPIVVSFHGADVSDALSDSELRDISRYASLLLHRSTSLRHALLARGAPVEKLRANPTGVPVPDLANVLQIGKCKPLRILQACRFIEKKGLDVTLRTAKEIVDSGVDVRLTLAGDGPQRHDLESIAATLGMASRVHFTGFLNAEQLAFEYGRHDFFLHPSRETMSGDREGIPNSLLEAMAYGLVVVGTRHSGIPEAVEDGINGLLVHAAEPSLIANAITQIIDDPARASRIGVTARQSVVDKFSTEASIRQLEGCYREAILMSNP